MVGDFDGGVDGWERSGRPFENAAGPVFRPGDSFYVIARTFDGGVGGYFSQHRCSLSAAF